MNAIIDTILKSETEQEVVALLEGKKRTELVKIAQNLDVRVVNKNMQQLKESIIAFTVGAKLRSRAIRGY